ncbi:Keratin, type I cytoskeletal 18 [Saguinus oedipus]|uniref:Keratin, type I cytoskeletal 18 n=1 Tax=Saguinus oedipus TaxID=9490 RepID=A0ABQ9U6K2_SAGOE|nr:Keratin, type I cytoskeletal 18 [Saguinus oedipus]
MAPSCSSRASVYADAGDSGSQIFMPHSTSFQGNMGSGDLAAGMAGGLAGMGSIQNEKKTMQSLNDCLAFNLDRLRPGEKNPGAPGEDGTQVRDWSHYFKAIEDLRAQILANTVDNAHIVLQINNACLAADDFRVKYETELAKRQSVESYLHELRKVTDDTNVTRLQLETEIEALREELLFMKKNHGEEAKGLQAQIASSGLTIEVDAPKSQDLTKIMADIQLKYVAKM